MDSLSCALLISATCRPPFGRPRSRLIPPTFSFFLRCPHTKLFVLPRTASRIAFPPP